MGAGANVAAMTAPGGPKRTWRKPASATRDQVRVIGAHRPPLRDVYHGFLRAPWWGALGIVVALYLALNACFAVAYLAAGGVEGARPGSFWDAFYFSVQTMGTIGYGAMHPKSRAANVLVVMESVTGLVVTALATGLVFTKFSQSTARIVFGERAVIGPMDGVPTLMLRVGNERGNQIIEAVVRVAMVRTERTREGMTFYRMHDLVLTRERSPALSRSWTAMHPITAGSPLHGQSPASLKKDEVELFVTIVGVDDTSLQPVHARHKYTDEAVVWGARHADVLSEDTDGSLVLDLRKFHELTPTAPTEDFPYPEVNPSAPSGSAPAPS
jgi:inward rectifier potassium channel